MKIDIIGAGSVGLLLAAKLTASGMATSVVTGGEEQASQLTNHGVKLIGLDGTEADLPMKARSFAAYEEEENSPADWVFLTVKQQHLDKRLIAAVGRHMGPETVVLCFQNGVGHLDRLSTHVPAVRLLSAVTTEGARRLSGSSVRHTGPGVTRIGRACCPIEVEDPLHDKLQVLVRCLEAAGFLALASNSIQSDIWNKLLINSVINPLTSLLRVKNGELLNRASVVGLGRALLEEGVKVAGGLGIAVSDKLWARVEEVCTATAGNHSSMLQDVMAGRATEADWINGSIIAEAERLGLEVPCHRTVFALVKGLEQLETPVRD